MRLARACGGMSPPHEPVAAFHPAAGGDDPAHGGGAADRHRRLSVPAALRAAGGRLSHHPGPDLLPRGEPGCDDLLGDGAAGAPAGPDAEPAADGLHQLGRRLGHHPAVQPRHQPRYRRAGGAGGDQRGGQSAALRSPRPADLCQGQSGRRPHPHVGADLQDPAAAPDPGSGRYPSGPEDLPGAGRGAGQHQRRAAAGGPGAGESARPFRLWPQHRRSAHDHRQCQCQHAQGQLRRAEPGLYHQRQRPAPEPRTPTTLW